MQLPNGPNRDAVRVVASPQDRAHTEPPARGRVEGTSEFLLVLPQLPESLFPITSQKDLESKVLGKISRLEIPQYDANPRPPRGHERVQEQ